MLATSASSLRRGPFNGTRLTSLDGDLTVVGCLPGCKMHGEA
ncbi:MAG: hypothetical protein ACLRIP_16045 [Blautia massiliensis (ex Durand et al. 2017)]